jgi:DNA-binding NtrC family response regulator
MERTLLVVDDELPVRESLRRILATDYTVLEAASGQEALDILRDRRVPVVISDNMMPEMTGIDLLKLVRVRYPHVLRMLLTGDPDPELPVRSINEGEVYRFIRKPWDNRDLRTILYFAFQVVDLQEENRRLIELGRKQRDVRKMMESESDPAGLEAELLLLAEAEADLLGD